MWRAIDGKVDRCALREALAGKADAAAMEGCEARAVATEDLEARVAALREDVQAKASSKVLVMCCVCGVGLHLFSVHAHFWCSSSPSSRTCDSRLLGYNVCD